MNIKDGDARERLFRKKALSAERRASEVFDRELKLQWQEIAIEWHALAGFAGRNVPDLDLE